MRRFMTQAEFARHRGVGRSAVSNWKAAGLLVMAEDPADGRVKVDVDRSEAKVNGRVDPGRGRPPSAIEAAAKGGDAPALPLEDAAPAAASPPAIVGRKTLADERTDHVREQRIGAALKNAQLAGELVPLAEAERRISEVGRAARDRMHSWLRGMAERFAAEREVRTIMALGEEGIDGVFDELATAARQGAFADDEDELTPEEEAELEAAAAASD